jgi:YggT family protein
MMLPRFHLLPALCVALMVVFTSRLHDSCEAFALPRGTRTPLPERTAGRLRMVPLEEAAVFTVLAETEAWVQPLSFVLGPFLNFMSLAMLSRVVLSWYPAVQPNEVPWIWVVLPTEPLLKIAKGFVPPAFGVDITPVFWLAIFTFLNEIFLGQQGLLTMKIKYGI